MRHLAPTDAKQRHRATDSAKKRQKEIAGAKKRRSAPSSLQRSIPFIRFRAETDSLRSSNFSEGKTDNLDMRTNWRDPISDRAAARSRREKVNA
jgi:hypothetical protein